MRKVQSEQKLSKINSKILRYSILYLIRFKEFLSTLSRDSSQEAFLKARIQKNKKDQKFSDYITAYKEGTLVKNWKIVVM